MELKEAIDKLFEMTDEQRLEVFDVSKVEDVLDSCYIKTIIKRMENFYSELKYGDVYVDKTDSEDKCVFLGEDRHDKYWLLCSGTYIPQEFSKASFEKYYVKTGKNVADKLSELFE